MDWGEGADQREQKSLYVSPEWGDRCVTMVGTSTVLGGGTQDPGLQGQLLIRNHPPRASHFHINMCAYKNRENISTWDFKNRD